MKTTVDLPDDLLHRAKVVAVWRQTTLQEMILRRLLHELEVELPEGSPEADALIEALSKGRNTRPIGGLHRDGLYAED